MLVVDDWVPEFCQYIILANTAINEDPWGSQDPVTPADAMFWVGADSISGLVTLVRQGPGAYGNCQDRGECWEGRGSKVAGLK